MRLISKIVLLMLAILAVKMAGRALKRDAEVIAALWTLVGLTAQVNTANTPKARSTEARLNALVPVVFPNTGGTVNGSMTVTGNHVVEGTMDVSGALSGAGGGAIENSSGMHTSGNMVVDGTLTVSGQRIAPGQGVPGAYPASGSPSTAGLGTYCNEIVGGLIAAGIFN